MLLWSPVASGSAEPLMGAAAMKVVSCWDIQADSSTLAILQHPEEHAVADSATSFPTQILPVKMI